MLSHKFRQAQDDRPNTKYATQIPEESRVKRSLIDEEPQIRHHAKKRTYNFLLYIMLFAWFAIQIIAYGLFVTHIRWGNENACNVVAKDPVVIPWSNKVASSISSLTGHLTLIEALERHGTPASENLQSQIGSMHPNKARMGEFYKALSLGYDATRTNPAIAKQFIAHQIAISQDLGCSTRELEVASNRLATPTILTGRLAISARALSTGSVSTFDLSVLKDGSFIQGLTEADFLFLDQDDRPFHQFVVEQVKRDASDYSVVILLDTSSSMTQRNLDDLKKAVTDFLNSVPMDTAIQLVAFDHEIVLKTAFTHNRGFIISSLSKLQPRGGTETAKALYYAVSQLAGRGGHKMILLATDGVDPKLASQLNSLSNECKDARIRIECLGIKAPALDTSLLTRLSMETGGTFVLADEVAGIPTAMDRIIRNSQSDCYRLTILTKDLGEHKLDLLLRGDETGTRFPLISH